MLQQNVNKLLPNGKSAWTVSERPSSFLLVNTTRPKAFSTDSRKTASIFERFRKENIEFLCDWALVFFYFDHLIRVLRNFLLVIHDFPYMGYKHGTSQRLVSSSNVQKRPTVILLPQTVSRTGNKVKKSPKFTAGWRTAAS